MCTRKEFLYSLILYLYANVSSTVRSAPSFSHAILETSLSLQHKDCFLLQHCCTISRFYQNITNDLHTYIHTPTHTHKSYTHAHVPHTFARVYTHHHIYVRTYTSFLCVYMYVCIQMLYIYIIYMYTFLCFVSLCTFVWLSSRCSKYIRSDNASVSNTFADC